MHLVLSRVFNEINVGPPARPVPSTVPTKPDVTPEDDQDVRWVRRVCCLRGSV